MKHKLSTILVLICLLMASFSTVLAQEKQPPGDSDDPAALPKRTVLTPGVGSSNLENGQILSSETSIQAVPTIVNGNFEQGSGVGWISNSTSGYTLILPSSSLIVPTHLGGWAVWLGGDENETSQIFQSNISILNPTYLRLWYLIGSLDVCGFDFGYIIVNSNIIHTWSLCEANDTNGWVELNLNLSAYSGQNISLSIIAVTDESLNSNLFIDDVSLYKTFADVSYDYWAQDWIQRLYNAGITGGCASSPLQYCPDNTVTRDQMAVFLEKGIHTASFSPPNVAPTFSDTIGHWAEDWIEALKNDGVTSGCGSGRYCPGDPVTRAQMAVFLLKAKYGSSYLPPSVGAGTGFNDVPTTHWAAAWIKQLAAEGITGGCGTGIYCPESAVTRAQMAVFLVRTFNLP